MKTTIAWNLIEAFVAEKFRDFFFFLFIQFPHRIIRVLVHFNEDFVIRIFFDAERINFTVKLGRYNLSAFVFINCIVDVAIYSQFISSVVTPVDTRYFVVIVCAGNAIEIPLVFFMELAFQIGFNDFGKRNFCIRRVIVYPNFVFAKRKRDNFIVYSVETAVCRKNFVCFAAVRHIADGRHRDKLILGFFVFARIGCRRNFLRTEVSAFTANKILIKRYSFIVVSVVCLIFFADEHRKKVGIFR